MSNKLTIIAAGKNLDFLPDSAQWTNRFEIKSETSNRLYTIAKNKKTGIWGCSCPGWITRRKCKHLTSIADYILRIEDSKLQITDGK